MPYYAVRVGRNPGIYESWDQAEREISRFAGAVFKKFNTRLDALAFMQQGPAQPKSLNIVSHPNEAAIKKCKCGFLAIQNTVQKQNENFGRTFLSCGSSGQQKCKYFHWLDGQPSGIKSVSNANLAVLEDTLVVFVDGACQGNKNVEHSDCPAGWGVAITLLSKGQDENNARLLYELYGPVIRDTNSPYFLGATVGE